MLIALVTRSLERARALIAALVVVMCGFQVVLAILASEMARTNTFSLLTTLMPTAVQNLAGGMVFGTFGGFAAFGFFHPVVVLVFCGMAVFLASEPAWEVEAGLVDLTLARAIPRALVMTRTLLVTCGATAAIAILMALAARVSMTAFAQPGAGTPALRTTISLAINLLVLGWWFGALSLLAAAFARRRSVAAGGAGLAAVGLYLLHLYAEMSTRAAAIRPLLPFHYFNASAILRDAASTWPRDVAILLLTAAVMAAVSYGVYERRDL
jgi:hypothetical protein